MDANSKAILQKVLKDNGHSYTASRLYVCELLWGHKPLSMNELVAQLNGKVDRASLYRTIHLFEDLGIVQRVYLGWKYKIELSDKLSPHHHHISCLGCKNVISVTDESKIEGLINMLASKYGFKATSHQLEIHGYCKKCYPAHKTLPTTDRRFI